MDVLCMFSNLQGHPQCLKKTITVALSVGSFRFGCTGALDPSVGDGATSLLVGVFQESSSCDSEAD
jgi:hypothetical protein